MLDNKEVLLKEIDLIQSCINRMAQNSFMVKGWTISLVAVILALLPEKVNIIFLCILVIIITTCFWCLDAFFLKMERLYRWKYNWVIKNRMESNLFFYDLNPVNKDMWCLNSNDNLPKEPCVLRIMFTKTLMLIYLTLNSLAIIVLFITIIRSCCC